MITPVALITASEPRSRTLERVQPSDDARRRASTRRRGRAPRPIASRSRSSATTRRRRPATALGIPVAEAPRPRGGQQRSTLGGRRRAAWSSILRGLAGAHGSRTHRATPSAAPPVLKTGGPTGTPPLPRPMVRRRRLQPPDPVRAGDAPYPCWVNLTFALAVVAFAIGVDNYIVAAMLPAVAAELNEPVSSVGLLASAYALPTAVLRAGLRPAFGSARPAGSRCCSA